MSDLASVDQLGLDSLALVTAALREDQNASLAEQVFALLNERDTPQERYVLVALLAGHAANALMGWAQVAGTYPTDWIIAQASSYSSPAHQE